MQRQLPIPTLEQADRFDVVLAWIEQHPEQHQQGSWIEPDVFYDDEFVQDHDVNHDPIPVDCNTTMCIAGAAAYLAGRPMHYFDDDVMTEVMVKESGFDVPVWAWASRYFGLHEWGNQAMVGFGDHPFDPDQNITDLRRWAQAIRMGAEQQRPALACWQELGDLATLD